MQDNPFDALPDVGGQRVAAFARMCGVTPQTYYNWVKKGLIPPPLKIGPNTSIVPNSVAKAFGERRSKVAA